MMHLDSIYRALGVPATFGPHTARVIDKTAGVEVGQVGEVKPALR